MVYFVFRLCQFLYKLKYCDAETFAARFGFSFRYSYSHTLNYKAMKILYVMGRYGDNRTFPASKIRLGGYGTPAEFFPGEGIHIPSRPLSLPFISLSYPLSLGPSSLIQLRDLRDLVMTYWQ